MVFLVAAVLLLALGLWSTLVARRVRQSDAEVDEFARAMAESSSRRESDLAAVQSAVSNIDKALEQWNLQLASGIKEVRSLTPSAIPVPALVGGGRASDPPHTQVPRSGTLIAGGRIARGYALQTVNMTRDAMVSRAPKQRKARSANETLGLTWNLPVEFIVPTLGIPRPRHSSARSAVAVEDMLAAKAVAQALLIRWPEANVHTSTIDPGGVWSPQKGNICLFCRDSRNPITKLVLGHPQAQSSVRVYFPEVANEAGGQPEFGIQLGDGPVRLSPSYGQEREVTEGDYGPTVLEDVALLARVVNPWDPAGKILVVAGVRAFGTLGAAEYVRTSWEELDSRTRGNDFACVLSVRAKYQQVFEDDIPVPLSEPTEVLTKQVELVPLDDIPAEVEIVEIELPAA